MYDMSGGYETLSGDPLRAQPIVAQEQLFDCACGATFVADSDLSLFALGKPSRRSTSACATNLLVLGIVKTDCIKLALHWYIFCSRTIHVVSTESCDSTTQTCRHEFFNIPHPAHQFVLHTSAQHLHRSSESEIATGHRVSSGLMLGHCHVESAGIGNSFALEFETIVPRRHHCAAPTPPL